MGPNATTLGYRIKQSLRNLGVALRCSIGLAPNCYLAKTAADLCKPDGLTILLKEDLPHALHCMKLQDVVGISDAMERRLHKHNITTVEQLCKLSSEQMREIWHSVLGETMWYWLRGEDWKEKADSPRRSIGKQHVLAPKYRTRDQAYLVGLKLLSNAAAKLRRLNLWARGIGVTIAFTHWGREQRTARTQGLERSQTHSCLPRHHDCKIISCVMEGLPGEYSRACWGMVVRSGFRIICILLGFFDDPKREAVSKPWMINKHFEKQHLSTWEDFTV
jgi:DNA polymerase-4